MSVVRTLIGNVKGPKGDTGATGATGAQGEAATIEVGTVTTGAYGTNASVTNSGTAQDAVFDFVIPQGAPGDEATDASNLTLNEITASSASYPDFTVAEQLKSVFGKIKKFLSDLKNNYVSKAMMTTSTDVSTPGTAVADAAAINSLNEDLTNNYATKSDLEYHSVLSATGYEIAAKTSVTVGTIPSAGTYLVVFRMRNTLSESVQLLFSCGNANSSETVDSSKYKTVILLVVTNATRNITLYNYDATAKTIAALDVGYCKLA